MGLIGKHALKMQRHRDIVGLTVILQHANKEQYEVQASVTKVNSDDINYASNVFQDKQSLKVNIAINDLKDAKAPLKGYTNIIYKMTTYEIVNPSIVGGFDDIITLYGAVYGK